MATLLLFACFCRPAFSAIVGTKHYAINILWMSEQTKNKISEQDLDKILPRFFYSLVMWHWANHIIALTLIPHCSVTITHSSNNYKV